MHAFGLCTKPPSDHSRESLWLFLFGVRDLSQIFLQGPCHTSIPLYLPCMFAKAQKHFTRIYF